MMQEAQFQAELPTNSGEEAKKYVVLQNTGNSKEIGGKNE
jgi:hypothetical protein